MNVVWISDSVEMRVAEMKRLDARLAELGVQHSVALRAAAEAHVQIEILSREIEEIKTARVELTLERCAPAAEARQGVIQFDEVAA